MGGVADAAASADRLLDEFGTLRRVINARGSRLRRCADEATCVAIAFYRDAITTVLQPEAGRPLIAGSIELDRYLAFDMADRTLEEFRVFFLDSSSALIRQETLGYGSVSECGLYVRKIVERAMELGAAGLVVVHNHPSGIASPSEADFKMTRRLAGTARELDIRLFDHLIVTSTGSYSWHNHGLL